MIRKQRKERKNRQKKVRGVKKSKVGAGKKVIIIPTKALKGCLCYESNEVEEIAWTKCSLL